MEWTYRDWVGKLPGRQVLVIDDYGAGDGLDIGLRHVLDRGVRLNLVAPTYFPLPLSLRKRRQGGQILYSFTCRAFQLLPKQVLVSDKGRDSAAKDNAMAAGLNLDWWICRCFIQTSR